MPILTSARYAAAASTLALLVALGGTSYAAVKVGTKDIRANAVTGAKIKDGAVTGADVKEATLGLVPNADTATYARDSGTVGGLTITPVDATLGTGPGRPRFVFHDADLEIELTCPGSGQSDLTATTSLAGGSITTVVVGDGDPAPGTAQELDLEDDAFGPGTDFDLLAGGNGNLNQVTFTYANPAGSLVQGTLVVDTDNDPEPCHATGYITSR